MNTYSKKSIQIFFAIVILLSAVVEALIICNGSMQMLYLVLMWLPALAAILYVQTRKSLDCVAK